MQMCMFYKFTTCQFGIMCVHVTYIYVLFRTLAELEYLEVDQYIWGILGDPITASSTEIILEVSPDRIMASVATDRCEQQQNSLCLLYFCVHFVTSGL